MPRESITGGSLRGSSIWLNDHGPLDWDDLGMYLDDDDVPDFLAAYANACAELGVAPLQVADVIVLAEALLTGATTATLTLH